MTEDRSSTRGILLRTVLGALGSLVLLAGILYGTFWLPFQPPHKTMPRVIEILPLEQEPPATMKGPQEPEYAWVDREADIVRIPVEQAMDLVVETLPVSEDAANPNQERERRDIPTDAGSGRFVNE